MGSRHDDDRKVLRRQQDGHLFREVSEARTLEAQDLLSWSRSLADKTQPFEEWQKGTQTLITLTKPQTIALWDLSVHKAGKHERFHLLSQDAGSGVLVQFASTGKRHYLPREGGSELLDHEPVTVVEEEPTDDGA